MKKLLFLLGLFLLPIHSLFASDAETEKLQWHLYRVEGILRKVDTSSLTEEQRVNRTKMLDRLHSYTEAGQFPNNDKFPGESVPFFRGSNEILCAVGYLMDADPEYKPFIENIVKSNNNVQLMEVQTDPTVNAWAKKYGFSILELSMIQPTYDYQKDIEPTILIKPLVWKVPFGAFIIFVVVSFLLSFYYYLRKNSVLAIKHFRHGGIAIGIFVLGIVFLLASSMFYALVLSRFF